MGIFRSIAGLIRLEYTSADVIAVLEEIGKKNVPVFDVRTLDEVTLGFTIYRKDLRKLEDFASRRGEQLKCTAYRGAFWPIHAFVKRPVLILGLFLILLTGIYLPGRILFISVEGNSEIPERLILEAAESCGLDFGTSRRNVRSEQVKNYLLDEVPQLKWAGVNTYGCRAVITVREREDKPTEDEPYMVRHIVAARDGIINSCTVTDGFGLCSVGQAVREGDILISGYTDCGITIRAGIANGEIIAATSRQLTVKTPSYIQNRTESDEIKTNYSLVIGKKRINFYKGSGISGGSCVKMYLEYVLTLPGGFTLPVSLVKETVVDCMLYDAQISDASQLLESFAANYLRNQMVSGSVITKAESVSESEGAFILTGNYACTESIGIGQDEKIGDINGKTDGTDRERRSGG